MFYSSLPPLLSHALLAPSVYKVMQSQMMAFKLRSTAFLLPSPNPAPSLLCLLVLSSIRRRSPKVLDITNSSGTRTGNMIRLSCRTSAPLRCALSLCPASPHRLVNAYHFISHSHILQPHKYGTYKIVSSTAASSEDESEGTLPLIVPQRPYRNIARVCECSSGSISCSLVLCIAVRAI